MGTVNKELDTSAVQLFAEEPARKCVILQTIRLIEVGASGGVGRCG